MKVIAIVQARTGSKRLPGKVLMKINNKSILTYIIESLRFSKLVDKIIVATTQLPEDDKIETLCKNLNVECFRGSDVDVLNRFYKCAKSFNGDLIVRLTGDNPLIDPTIIDELIKICKESQCDYATNVLHPTYPYGFSSCEVIPFRILKKLNKIATDPMSREHVTIHIRKNPNLYTIKEIQAPKNLERPNWRLTIDYPEDMELMKNIFSSIYKNGSFISYAKLVNFLDNQDLIKINQKYQKQEE
jgi:spore coat polysaccharide biosynthesis protein SpsF